MIRALRRVVFSAAALAGALAALPATPAQAGWGLDPTQVRDVGPQLTALQVFRDNDRVAPDFTPDHVAYAWGTSPETGTAVPSPYGYGATALSTDERCAGSPTFMNPSVLTVQYVTYCDLPASFTAPGTIIPPAAGYGVSMYVMSSTSGSGGYPAIGVTDGSVKLLTGISRRQNYPDGGWATRGGLAYQSQETTFGSTAYPVCGPVYRAACRRGVRHTADGTSAVQSLWGGNLGLDPNVSSIVTASTRKPLSTSKAQGIDVYSLNDDTMYFIETLGSSDATQAGAKRLCAPSRVTAGQLGGTASKEIVRFGPDCSDRATGDFDQSTAALPTGIEAWTNPTGGPGTAERGYVATSARPWRVPNRPGSSVTPKLSDLVLADLNADGDDDFVMGFSTGGYAIAFSGEGAAGAGALAPMALGYRLVWGEAALATTPVNQVGVGELSSTRTDNPTGGLDLAIATDDGLVAFENDGASSFPPFDHFNADAKTTIARTTVVGGPVKKFSIGRLDHDLLNDIAVYDGAKLSFHHQVTRGPRMGAATTDRMAATTGDTVTIKAAPNPTGSNVDTFNDAIGRIAVDVDGDGVLGESGEPSSSAANVATEGVAWQPAAAGVYRPKVYVFNRGGLATIVPFTFDITVTSPLAVVPLSGTQATGQTGLAHPWNFQATATGGTPPYTYAWSAPGDATPPASSATGATYAPRFATAANKIVSVTVTDSAGESVTRSQTVRAADALAAAITGVPADPPQTGDRFTVGSAVSGGIGPHALAWAVSPVGGPLSLLDPVADPTMEVEAESPGSATISMGVTDATGLELSPAPSRAITVVPALTATFVQQTAAPQPGTPVSFSADGRVQGGFGTYTYAWSVARVPAASASDDFTASSSTAATFAPTFTRPGSYAIALRVTDGRGRFVDETKTVKVAAPVGGSIRIDNPSPQVGETVELEARPTGGVPGYTYRWDTDGTAGYDAAAGTAATTSLSFPTAGNRTISVEVTDSTGTAEVLDLTVGVAVELTAVLAVGPATPAVGQEITADAGATRGGKPGYTFAWTVDGTPVSGVSGPQLRRTFGAPGRHRIAVTVTDALGRTDGPVQRDVKVADDLVARIAIDDDHPEAGEEVTFDAAGTTGGLAPLRFRWDLDGDGTFDTAPSSDATRTLTLPRTPGVHTVGLQVTDDDGVIATATRAVTATEPLAAALVVSPAIAMVGADVTFDAAGTVGGAGALTFAWDLDGNGSFETSTGAVPTAKRAYSDPGDVDVRVRVTDPYGHVSTKGARATVSFPLTVSLTAPANAETGTAVLLDASATKGGLGDRSYAFDTDGDGSFETETARSATYEARYAAASTTLVRVRVRDERGQEATAQAVVDIAEQLVAAVTGPNRREANRALKLSAAESRGGSGNRTYAWDFDGDGTYELDTKTVASAETTYTTIGSRRIGLRVSDALGRERTATHTVDIVADCVTQVDLPLGKVEAEPGVCLRNQGTSEAPRYTTTGSVKLNGQLLAVAPGGSLTIRPPSQSAPGGRITGEAVGVVVQGSRLFDGPMDWKLPNGAPGDLRNVGGVSLPNGGVKFLGLEVKGKIGVAIGTDSAGLHYVRLNGNLSIPSFKVSADRNSLSVTGAFDVRIDQDGPHLDNVLLRAQSAYLGSVEVNDICLSYLAAGISEDDGARCEQFEDFDGQPFLTCKSDDKTNRWDGTVDVSFPGSGTGIAASGGLANSQLSHIGLKGQFGRSVPLKPGLVWLKGIAAGVCLKPALSVKGSAQIGAIAKDDDSEVVTANGSFQFDEAQGGKPWALTIKGGLNVMDYDVGQAYFGLDGDKTASFGWKSSMAFPHDKFALATIDGSVDGWIELKNNPRFNVEGSVRACVISLICTGGEAVLSSEGVSACITLFEAKIYYPTLWPPDYDSYTVKVRGGFGYKWGGGVKVMVASCDIGPWRATRSSIARRSQTGADTRTFEVADGQPLASLRVHGVDAAPKVILRGPNGETIQSDPAGPGVFVENEHMIYEDEAGKATQMMVFKPAPGRWTVEAQPGSAFTAELDQADYIGPTSVDATVDANKAAERRTVEYAWSQQPATSVRLVELGEQAGVRQTLGTLAAGSCDARLGRTPMPSSTKGPKIACGSLSFRPSAGLGGTRKIVAEIVRDGLTVETLDVTTYEVAATKPPRRTKALQLRRGKKSVTATWASVPNAARYDVVTTDTISGTRLYKARGTCRKLTVRGIGASRALTVQVTGVDALGRPGKTVKVRMNSRWKVAAVGRKGAVRFGC